MSAGWFWLDTGRGDYAYNMALDHALLEGAPELNAPVLRFYGWQQAAASFGYFQKIEEIERTTLLRPLVRRPTGGGLVPHDRDWTYSVVIPPSHRWYELRAAESYEQMHAWIQRAFASIGVATELAPCCRKDAPGQCFVGYEKSDVLWFGKKIAGAAQRRTKTGLLIQGSVQPPPPGVQRDAWQQAMRSVGEGSFRAWTLSENVHRHALELSAQIYSQDSHNRRR
jgi:lipoate-protein ligase A